jgi:hypothetical protein
MNGIVAIINTDRMAPAIIPNVKTIFFTVRISSQVAISLELAA